MNLRYRYLDEKLSKARDTLAAGRGSIQERLRDAFIYHLHHLDADRFPADLAPYVRRLRSAMTQVAGSGGQGSIDASVAQMTADQAGDWVQVILRLQDQVAARLESPPAATR